MYIPDPSELMDSRIEDLIFEWEILQKDVPPGKFRCPQCKKIREGEPIQLNSRPDSPMICYYCLPSEVKKAYDEFEKGRTCDSNSKL